MRMKLSRTVVVLAIASAFLLIVNIHIFIHRRDGYNLMHVGYKTLYIPRHIPCLTGLEIRDRNRLKAQFSGVAADRWKILPDSGAAYESAGPAPEIVLQDRTHTYMVVAVSPANTKEFQTELTIDFSPQELYAAAGNPTADSYLLLRSGVPAGRFARLKLEEFAYAEERYRPEEVLQGRAILDSLGVRSEDDTETKMKLIGRFLVETLGPRGGIPVADMESLTPLEQLRRAVQGKSPVWCSSYQHIYTFLAALAGIPTRLVNITGQIDDVNLGNHAFAESYIREKEQWAFCDLSTGKLFVRNRRNDFMNSVDLYHAQLSESLGDLTAAIYRDSGLIMVPYAEVADAERYYFTRDAIFVFPMARQIPLAWERRMARYLWKPDLAYSLAGGNARPYLKFLLLYSNLGLILVTVGVSICSRGICDQSKSNRS